MAQIFHRSFNTISKVSILGGVFMVAGLGWAWAKFVRSDYVTGVGLVRDQPVPFSHQHHVGGLGIDCRYCHVAVEDSKFAGVPATKTCYELPHTNMGRQPDARTDPRKLSQRQTYRLESGPQLARLRLFRS